MRAAARRLPAGWPLAAICLYAALIPLQPVFVLPDGSPLRLAAADAVAPLVFLAALVRPRRRIPFGLAATVTAIPMLALFSTLLAAIDRPLSLYAVGKTAGLFYLVGLCLAAVRSTGPDAAPAIVRALGRGAFWSAVIGLVGFAAYLGGTPNSLVQGERLCSTMTGDPNIYGSLVGVGLLVSATERTASPAARLVRSVVLTLALLATGSRSAVLGTIAAFVVCAAVRSRDPFAAAARNTYLLLAAGLAAVALLVTDTGSTGASRIWEHHWREFTVDSRLDLYTRALEQFTENPVTGLGIGGFRELNSFEVGGTVSHFVVHNTYLWALVDLGIAGGLLVVGLIGAAAWRCVRAARGHPAAESAAVIAAGLGAMAVFNLFIDGFYQRHFWVLMACAIGTPVYRPVRQTIVTAWRARGTRAAA
jgi:O-antigen ligase